MAVDARVRYTKMMIKKTLIDLMKNKHISKISVKEICDTAQINRSTFYKHYNNVEDLVEKIEAELINELKKSVNQSKKKGTKKTLVEMLEVMKSDIDLYCVLLSENGDAFFRNKLVSELYTELLETFRYNFSVLPQEEHNWLLAFLDNGAFGVLDCWIIYGMKEPTERVAEFMETVMNSAIKAVIKR
ncbi:MAG: TetR/AcrR family transcriptional regulator [Clostridia bacterium]|nr:TetR/AcrR family transcriptional regulator [Clostridia bacterium]